MKFWSQIMVPAAVLGMAAVQTVGTEARIQGRTPFESLRSICIDSLQISMPAANTAVQDTVRPDTAAQDRALQDTAALDAAAQDTAARQGTAVQRDTAVQDTTVQLDSAVQRDSAARGDSIAPQKSIFDDEEYDLFADTLDLQEPQILARDTMKVPDSLQYTDPFLYKWYIAVKDSLTHRIVIDSLKAAGDSLDWPVIDSLYLKDSAEVATARFNAWFSTLTKREQKRYLYEQELPKILHRMDSIQNAKDSLRMRRDSIRESIPRILETFAVPDSMHYKRILVWRHDRYFNKVNLQPLDTGFNSRFHDYPVFRNDVGAAWLGVAGSAYQTYDFFKRRSVEGISFYDAVENWSYSPETLPMYNTKTPYTELQYTGSLFVNDEKASDNLHLMTTQNILPALNFTVEYDRFGGNGMLAREQTANKTFTVHVNWLGKKHLVHAGYIYNRLMRDENGGLVDPMWIRDTTVDVREIQVHLTDAHNEYKKRTLFLDQTYRIPFTFLENLLHRKDTSGSEASPALLQRDITTAFIGHASEYSVYTKKYTDEVTASSTGSDFYHGNFFVNPSKSSDSLRVAKLDNRIFLRLQPWSEDAIVSKVEGGVGDRILNHYLFSPENYLRKGVGNTVWNTAYIYAGAEGNFQNYIAWDALGSYSFTGPEANDFFVRANARLSFYPFRRARKSPVSLSAHFETSLKEPGFYEQNFYSNHFRWQNSFSKTTLTKIGGTLDIPHWGLQAEVDYALISNNIWYDSLGVVQQNTSPMSVIKAGISKNFTFGGLHLDHRALLQWSSNQEVLPLPNVALNLRYYFQFNIVSPEIMQMQIGANGRYTTLWYAPSYNPVAGVFTAQSEMEYGNCPYIDVFLNIQWKRACIFVKLENINNGWPNSHKDYFSAHHYIYPPRDLQNVKIGIFWPFYVQSARTRTLSSRAGAGMGGGSSGESAFGDLTNGIGR